jgi:hypothetical protein
MVPVTVSASGVIRDCRRCRRRPAALPRSVDPPKVAPPLRNSHHHEIDYVRQACPPSFSFYPPFSGRLLAKSPLYAIDGSAGSGGNAVLVPSRFQLALARGDSSHSSVTLATSEDGRHSVCSMGSKAAEAVPACDGFVGVAPSMVSGAVNYRKGNYYDENQKVNYLPLAQACTGGCSRAITHTPSGRRFCSWGSNLAKQK